MNKRNKFIYKSIKKNLKVWVKFSFGKKEHVAGKRFENHTETEVVTYIENVYDNYLKYGDLTKEYIKNKRILEVGPGDSFGIAIKSLFDGAKEVICFDKFYANRNNSLLKKAYQILFSKQNKYVFNDLFNADLIPNKPISYYYGKGIEEVKLKNSSDFQKNSFDLIISNQVIQEIYNPKPAFKKMIELLDVGGKMIHHIDFEPYNYFRAHSKKEYDFLTYPEYIYKWMVNKRGMSNRKRVSDYIKILDAYENISYKILVHSCFLNKKKLDEVVVYPDFTEGTRSFYSKIVESQKSDFVKKYKNLPIEDFIVGNAYLIIEKKK
jgi:hypothetical protein